MGHHALHHGLRHGHGISSISLTTPSIPTIQSLGIAFGAAVAGLVANAAGLAVGVSPPAVASAATWVYLLGIIRPTVMVILSGRLLWLHQQRSLRPLDGLMAG